MKKKRKKRHLLRGSLNFCFIHCTYLYYLRWFCSTVVLHIDGIISRKVIIINQCLISELKKNNYPFFFSAGKLRVCKNLLWKSLTAGSRQQTTAGKSCQIGSAWEKITGSSRKELNIAAFDPVSRDGAGVFGGGRSDRSFAFTSVGAWPMAFSLSLRVQGDTFWDTCW